MKEANLISLLNLLDFRGNGQVMFWENLENENG